MGLRGPAPTPTKILELNGSWRAKTRTGEPGPEMGKPRCPKRLTGEARKVWQSVTTMLDDMGILGTIDGNALERYCTFFVRWRECEDFIAKNGMTYPLKCDGADAKNYIGKLADGTAIVAFEEYPQVRISVRLDEALRRIEQQFGLTPSSRARLTVPPREEEDDGVATRPRIATGTGGAIA